MESFLTAWKAFPRCMKKKDLSLGEDFNLDVKKNKFIPDKEAGGFVNLLLRSRCVEQPLCLLSQFQDAFSSKI